MSAQPVSPTWARDIERERVHLLRFARMRLSDAHAAEDAVQDTLLAAWLSAGSSGGFSGRSSLRTWLTAILHHKVMDAYRRNASEARVRDYGPRIDAEADYVAHAEPAPDTGDPARQLERKQLSATLLSAIDELPSRQRDVFVLHQMQGYSGDEIAKRVGLSSNNVWVILHRARHALRAQLHNMQDTEECLTMPGNRDHRQTHDTHAFSHA